MRCRGQWSDVIAAGLAGAVMLMSVWGFKHAGAPLDGATMLWIDAAAGAGYLVLRRVLSQR